MEHNENFYNLMPPFELGKKLPVGITMSYPGPV